MSVPAVSRARDVAYVTLRRSLDERAYADRAFTAEADRAALDGRERGLAMHLAYGSIQRVRTLDAALAAIAGRRADRLERQLAHALRLGIFQLLFADGMPAHAAVSETVELVRRRIGQRATGLANAVLRRVADEGPAWLAALPDATAAEAAVRHSLPDFVAERWFAAFGPDRGRALCRAANVPPETVLRPNPLRAAPGQVEALLGAAGVGFASDPETGALVLADPFDYGGSSLLRNGLAVAQSRASIRAGARVGAAPGMRVLDLCSAPGGKASQLAAAGAELTAVEAHAGRAERLRQTLQRLGARAEVVCGDAREYVGGPFDRILLDAPCSGNGVLAGRPDARWRRDEGDYVELAALQRELLAHAATLRAPDGLLVYAVCTLDPDENEGAVVGAGLAPRDERRSWPGDGDDGFYTAEAT